MGLVSLVVAVVVIGLVAVPVIEDSTTGTQIHGSNTEYADTWTYFPESPTFTLERSSSGITLTSGGSTRTVTGNTSIGLLSDALRFNMYSDRTSILNFDTSRITNVNDTSTAISLVVSNGSYTLTIGENEPVTGTMDTALVRDPAGTWGRYVDKAIKITPGSTYFLSNTSTTGVPGYLALASGGNFESFVINSWSTNGATTIVPGYDLEFEINYQLTGGGQVVGNVFGVTTYFNDTSSDRVTLYAPIEFVSSASSDGGMDGILLSIIPTLLIIVAIMVAVRLIRND